MHDLIAIISKHGYAAVFLVVLAEAMGLPVPAALALVAAGAAVASHTLGGPAVVLVAVLGMALGDSLLFFMGRKTGWGLLGFLCKISINPETCILRSAESFYKRGRTTLLLAKFIPGINTMAPPLAGSMRMPYQQFAALDVVGISLYVLAYGALGFVFRDFLASMMHGFQAAGRAVEWVVIIAALAYVAYRLWVFSQHRVYRVVPRVQVEEVARKLASDDGDHVLLIDVRSHGYYDAGASRIQGSIRLEPNHLMEEIGNLPRDKDIYVYCS